MATVLARLIVMLWAGAFLTLLAGCSLGVNTRSSSLADSTSASVGFVDRTDIECYHGSAWRR
jgi:hypothetical protein